MAMANVKVFVHATSADTDARAMILAPWTYLSNLAKNEVGGGAFILYLELQSVKYKMLFLKARPKKWEPIEGSFRMVTRDVPSRLDFSIKSVPASHQYIVLPKICKFTNETFVLSDLSIRTPAVISNPPKRFTLLPIQTVTCRNLVQLKSNLY